MKNLGLVEGHGRKNHHKSAGKLAAACMKSSRTCAKKHEFCVMAGGLEDASLLFPRGTGQRAVMIQPCGGKISGGAAGRTTFGAGAFDGERFFLSGSPPANGGVHMESDETWKSLLSSLFESGGETAATGPSEGPKGRGERPVQKPSRKDGRAHGCNRDRATAIWNRWKSINTQLLKVGEAGTLGGLGAGHHRRGR